ncbi:MAG TPA: hypothetical protein VHS59_14170 [Bacillota bacterium]|nr:hypothetical protein [Bacillota bacterium]
MKKFSVLTAIVVIGIAATGCGLGAKPTVESNPAPQKVAKTTAPSEDQQNREKPATQQRPKAKKIEVVVEGEKEMREAALMESEALGYSLYVLKNFSLTQEEPGKDVLISKYDGDFFARIEKLSQETDIKQYKNQQKIGFQQVGEVTELDPSTLAIPRFQDAEFCLLTQAKAGEQGQQTTIQYLVKDFNGKLFAITFHMPLKEAAEGITPSLWSMVATLEAK